MTITPITNARDLPRKGDTMQIGDRWQTEHGPGTVDYVEDDGHAGQVRLDEPAPSKAIKGGLIFRVYARDDDQKTA